MHQVEEQLVDELKSLHPGFVAVAPSCILNTLTIFSILNLNGFIYSISDYSEYLSGRSNIIVMSENKTEIVLRNYAQ